MDNNQLDLLSRKLDEILAPTKISIVSSNRIRIGKDEFEFFSRPANQEISKKTVTSR